MNEADIFSQQSTSIRNWYHEEQEAAARPCHLYALVDGILDTTVLPQIEQTSVAWCSLYPDSMIEAASPASCPYLVDLGRDNNDSALVIRLLLERDQTMDFALWIVSQHPLPALAAHLQQYAEVELPDKSLALLRYYDPSILSALLRTFTSDQRQRFLAAWRRCAWRRETWASIDGGDSDMLQPLPGGRIALDDTQSRQLGVESFAESLYYRIREDLLPPASQLEVAKCIEYIRELVTKAGRNYQMTRQADLMLFALTGLNVSPKFDEHPDVMEVLHADSATRESLANRLARVDDKVWKELRNTRPKLS